jgi:UDP-N-acetylmuramate: L-alanyl-gamma-D-glutamyl-meso-diaminopimelate ligase
LIAVIEPRSNTMRIGTHKNELAASVSLADHVFWSQPDNLDWDLSEQVASDNNQVFQNIDELVDAVVAEVRQGDHLVIMSNGGFQGIHQTLIKALDFTDDYE